MLVGESRDASAGAGFAAAVGARRGGTTDQRRVLDVDADLPGRLADLTVLAGRRASGYSLQSWSGMAAEPDVDQLAAVIEAIADAPRPGSMKAEQWDAARVRADEARSLALGLTVHSIAARHDQSGELAALTQVCIDPLLPGWAFQLLTVVARRHRGHRLGLLVKVAMHRLLVEQRLGVRRIMTTNEASNQPMIGINEQLGYRITDTFASWELPVADALVAAG
jgi:RimJ/RimL family protein N-acetyltransferase